MPKKLPKHKKAKDHSLKLTFIILGSFLLLLGLSVFLQIKDRYTNPLCANSISCLKDLSGEKQASNEGIFMGKKVISPNMDEKPVFALSQTQNVLGDTTPDFKHIYIDLTNQR